MGSALSTCKGQEKNPLNNAADTDDDADSIVPAENSKKLKTQTNTNSNTNAKHEKEVKKMLKCPVCLEMCVPPIYQCDSGHHLCGKCNQRLTKCPTCQSKYRGTRNFILENYFDENCSTLSLRCQFAKHGCKEIVAGKNLRNHLENCRFRPLACIVDDCKQPGNSKGGDNFIPMSEYLDHLVKIHGAIYWKGQRGEFTIHMSWPANYPTDIYRSQTFRMAYTYSFWKPQLFQFHGFTFILVTNIRDLTLHTWVMIFGDENEANQFRVKFLVASKNEAINISKSCISWEGPVFPIRSSKKSIMDESKCLLMSPDFVKSICGPTPKVYCKVGWTIKCKLTTKKEGDGKSESETDKNRNDNSIINNLELLPNNFLTNVNQSQIGLKKYHQV